MRKADEKRGAAGAFVSMALLLMLVPAVAALHFAEGGPVMGREPQGLAWHPRTGALFESEHGPSGDACVAPTVRPQRLSQYLVTPSWARAKLHP